MRGKYSPDSSYLSHAVCTYRTLVENTQCHSLEIECHSSIAQSPRSLLVAFMLVHHPAAVIDPEG